ncbi:hypothetical protein [Aneurinibacillus soli]|nr:hypothetical protein [Aneurinibacillus soli]
MGRLFLFVVKPEVCGGEWEKGGAVRLGTLAEKLYRPLLEPSELARKEKPTMHARRRIAGKGPFAILPSLSNRVQALSCSSLLPLPNNVLVYKNKKPFY